MARPERRDVDYFPFFVKDGRTLFILEDKYGCKGTGFFTNMMRFLCLTPDHHFCISDEADRLFFFSKTKCDEVSGIAMLDLMAKTGKIYAPLWVSDKVIVSPDLLASLKGAYAGRKNEIITLEEIISVYSANKEKEVSSPKNPQDGEFPTQETTPDASFQEVSSPRNPQTKLKETKLNIIIKERGSLAPLPQQEIIDAYHEILPMLPHVREWSKTRQGHLNICLQDKSRQSITWWKDYFGKVRDSPFLLGQNHRGWRADLEWLTKKSNLIKVLEEKYDVGGSNGGSRQKAIGRGTSPVIGAAAVAKSDSAPYPVDHIF